MGVKRGGMCALVACMGMAVCAQAESAKNAQYVRAAGDGVKTLQAMYDESTGLYAKPSGWWNAANAMTVLVNYERLTDSHEYDAVLAHTFTAAQKTSANFVNKYYDDDGWWALAWMDAYDWTYEPQYLAMAETIFATMEGSWDTDVCGGGAWWNTHRKYKNAIANELYLEVAAGLANRTKGAKRAEYLGRAQAEWQWFKATGMINAENLVNDGLTTTDPHACTNNGRRTWSYNQGVILGGLVELAKAEKDKSLVTEAETIADAAMTRLTTADGVMTEPVRGNDAPQFKGVFLRNLRSLDRVASKQERKRYKEFSDRNAASIVRNDVGSDGAFGGLWEGPFDSADATRQTSALDALIAAAAMK